MWIKTEIEIVGGFLGAGKTTFINFLLDRTLTKGEKILIIQCERGNSEIQEKFRKNPNIIIKYYDPFTDITRQYINALNGVIRPDRIIIEYNGSKLLDNMKEVLSSRDGEYFYKLSTVFYVVDYNSFSILFKNLSQIVMSYIYNADMIVFTNERKVAMTNIEEIKRYIEGLNEKSVLITLSELMEKGDEINKYRLFEGGKLKEVKLKIKNSMLKLLYE